MNPSISKKLHSTAVLFLGLTSLGLIIEVINTQDSHYIVMLMISGFSAMSLSMLLLLVYNRINAEEPSSTKWERVPNADAYFDAVNELNKLSCSNRRSDDLLDEVLSTGCRFLRMNQGRITCIDLQNRSNSVSRMVVIDETGNPVIGIDNRIEDNTGLEVLISSSIVINKHFYGTVSFYCGDDGKRPVTQADRSLVNIISTIIVSILESEAEKKQAEADGKGELARQSKSSFIRNLSHELRTPLTDILGYSDMLLEDVTDKNPDNIKADINRIRKASSTLLTLVNDVLDLTSIENDEAGLNTENLSAEIIVKEAAISVRPVLESRKNSLSVHIVTNLGFIMTDAARCRQTLVNMVSVLNKMVSSAQINLTVDRLIEKDGETIVYRLAVERVQGLAARLETIVHYDECQGMQDHTDFSVRLALYICQHYCQRLGGELDIASGSEKGYLLQLSLPVNQSYSNETEQYLDYAMMNLAS